MQRVANSLVPASEHDQELFDSVKGQVLVTVRGIRNPDHLKRFWALADTVARFDRDFHDGRAAVRWVKRQIPNMHKRYMEKDGTLVIELQSIAIGAMDQTRFNRFYDRAAWLWSERLKCDVETLLEHANEDQEDQGVDRRNRRQRDPGPDKAKTKSAS